MKGWTPETLERLRELPTPLLQRLYEGLRPYRIEYVNQVIALLAERDDLREASDILGVNRLPGAIYSLCENESCAKEVIHSLTLTLGKDFPRAFDNMRAEHRRSQQLIFGNQLLNSPQGQHFDLIIKAGLKEINERKSF